MGFIDYTIIAVGLAVAVFLLINMVREVFKK